MSEMTSLGLGIALLTVSLVAPMAIADDAEAPDSFEAYLEAAEAAGIEGEEHHADALVPAGMALEVTVDLRSMEATTASVLPPTPHGTPAPGSSANCLVLEPGEDGGLTPGAPVNVRSDSRPEGVPACQDDQAEHHTGTDEMTFVTRGDDESLFRLQVPWQIGFGWVWIECGTDELPANFAIGPYDDLQHYECYINNYGDPASWDVYTAEVGNGHSDPGSFSYGEISYVG